MSLVDNGKEIGKYRERALSVFDGRVVVTYSNFQKTAKEAVIGENGIMPDVEVPIAAVGGKLPAEKIDKIYIGLNQALTPKEFGEVIELVDALKGCVDFKKEEPSQ